MGVGIIPPPPLNFVIKLIKMDKVVIEVPQGQVAKVNKQADGNVLVTFENVEHWKLITSVYDAVKYLESKCMCIDLIEELQNAPSGSYSEKLAGYRIVVAALTNNEKRHLTTGERWYPVVQFCKPGKEENCWGKEIIGSIESEGQKFTVMGGGATYGAYAGLGNFHSYYGVSDSHRHFSFQSVSRREIAEHISKYFGRLLFEIHYGSVNCDWKWVN